MTPPFTFAKGFEAGCAVLFDAPKVKEDAAPGTAKLNDCCWGGGGNDDVVFEAPGKEKGDDCAC